MPMSIAGGPDIPASALIGPDVAVDELRRAHRDAAVGLLPSVRRADRRVDPKLALAQVRTLQDDARSCLGADGVHDGPDRDCRRRGAAARLIGIYGVMSYMVNQRTGEIGIRMALGAKPGSVAAMIVRQGGLVALAGIGVGLAAASPAAGCSTSLLFGVSTRDPGVSR